MDLKTEGYLAAAIGLIPTGVGMIAAPGLEPKLIGIALVGLGLAALYLRGKKKDQAGTA